MQKFAWIWIMIGGALGSILRYSLSKCYVFSVFPWATLSINITGSFLIGLFSGIFAKGMMGQQAQWFWVTGLLGGFTTFSAFSLENLQFLREGAWGQAALYIFISMAGGIAACAIGWKLTSQF